MAAVVSLRALGSSFEIYMKETDINDRCCKFAGSGFFVRKLHEVNSY